MKKIKMLFLAAISLLGASGAFAAHYDVVCRGGNSKLDRKITWRSKAAYQEAVKAKCPTIMVQTTWTNKTIVCISSKYMNVKKGERQPANAPRVLEAFEDVLKVFPKSTKLLVTIGCAPMNTSDTSCADAFDAAVKKAKINPKNVTVITSSPECLVPFCGRYPDYSFGLIGILGMNDGKRCAKMYEVAKVVKPKIAIFDWVVLEDCVNAEYLAKYRDELKLEFGMYAINDSPDTFKSGLETLKPKTIYTATPHEYCERAKKMFPGCSFSVK